MTVFNVPLVQLQLFFLIFLRVSAIMVTVPLFDSRNVPTLFKAGLAVTMSFLLLRFVNIKDMPIVTSVVSFGIGVFSEIAIGVIIGLSVRMLFAGVQLAGQLAGYQMGFAIVNVVDPLTSVQVSIVAQLKNLVAMLIFLSINAHHHFLQGIVKSFELVPPFQMHVNGALADQLMRYAYNMFVVALKIGAPIIVALLLTSVALGLVARTVPQMNIFIVAFPLKIVVGLLFLGFALPFMSAYLRQIFSGVGDGILLLLRSM